MTRRAAGLTDEAIVRMLGARRAGPPSPDFVADVMAAASTTRQRRGWLGAIGRDGSPRGRLVPVALLVVLALVVAAVAVVGSGILRDRNELTIAPSPPPKDAVVVQVTPAPSGPPSGPPASAEPTQVATQVPTSCAPSAPPDQVRITTIDLPSQAYAKMAAAGCAIWILNNQNGAGVHRVDIATNQVDTFLRKPIQEPITDLAADPAGGELWLRYDEGGTQLHRLDAATQTVTTSWPVRSGPGLGGSMWILDGRAWITSGFGDRRHPTLTVVDLGNGRALATIPDVQPWAMWALGGAVYGIGPGSPGELFSEPPSTQKIARIDLATYSVTLLTPPWNPSEAVNAWTMDGEHLFVSGVGQILELTPDAGSVVRRIPLSEATAGALLASAGGDLWAVPVRWADPPRNSFDNLSREIVRIDPGTGAITARVAHDELGSGLFNEFIAADSSLWMLVPDSDYARTFGMHLVRIDLSR